MTEQLLWIASDLVAAIEALPLGVYEGAHRYDTDDEHVLHVWRDGQSWDIRFPQPAPSSKQVAQPGGKE